MTTNIFLQYKYTNVISNPPPRRPTSFCVDERKKYITDKNKLCSIVLRFKTHQRCKILYQRWTSIVVGSLPYSIPLIVDRRPITSSNATTKNIFVQRIKNEFIEITNDYYCRKRKKILQQWRQKPPKKMKFVFIMKETKNQIDPESF